MWLTVRRADSNDFVVAVPLLEGSTTVGRGRGAQLILSDPGLSASHVELQNNNGSVSFRDLNSAAGTSLNGHSASQGSLQSGDKLSIGRYVVQLSEKRPNMGLEARRKKDKSPQTEGATSITQLLESLRSNSRPKKLLAHLLQKLVPLVGAQRGYVLLREKTKGPLVPIASHSIDDITTFVSLSSTVCENAISSNSPVIIEDSAQMPPGREALSMALYETPRSIVCVPLSTVDETYGVLYLDMNRSADGLSRSTVEAISAGAALAAEKLTLYKTRWRLVAARDRAIAFNSLSWADTELIMGDSPASKQLKKTIAAAANQDTTVLILGATGTGKEVVARALHQASSRKKEPFVAVNCAALPLDLLEAELFGAEKGAYTGATERRLGRFELANGGTLFLDEIGELPQDIQVRLLRVLQERKMQRLGGNEDIELDFRLICATNRDLEQAVQAGTFRADFYYRINVFSIALKPLSERKEEIKVLSNHFLQKFAKQFGRNFEGFSEGAERQLLSYSWPGNIRELRNAIERAAVIEQTNQITESSLPLMAAPSSPSATSEMPKVPTLLQTPLAFDEARQQFEKEFLKRSLLSNDGNIAAVVRETGIGRPTIYRWLKRYNLKTDGSDG